MFVDSICEKFQQMMKVEVCPPKNTDVYKCFLSIFYGLKVEEGQQDIDRFCCLINLEGMSMHNLCIFKLVQRGSLTQK